MSGFSGSVIIVCFLVLASMYIIEAEKVKVATKDNYQLQIELENLRYQLNQCKVLHVGN